MPDIAVISPISTIPSSGASQSIAADDNSTGFDRYVDLTLTSNCAITLTAPSKARLQSVTIRFSQGGTGGYSPSFGNNVAWANGVQPQLNTLLSAYDEIEFRTMNSGTSWIAVPIALNVLAPATPLAPSVMLTPGNGQNKITVFGPQANPAVTGYKLYKGTATGATVLVGPITLDANGDYLDTSLANDGTIYFYRVLATNGLGDGALSAEVSGQPSDKRYFDTKGFAQLYTPHLAAYIPAGNPIDVRVRAMAKKWSVATGALACTWAQPASDGTTMWMLYFDPNTSRLAFAYINASNAAVYTVSTVDLPSSDFPNNTIRDLRATRDPTSGAITFYYSVDRGVTWIQLGAAVTAATGAIRTPSSPRVPIIGNQAGGFQQFFGRVYDVSLRINGTIVFDSLVEGATAGAASFADAVSGGTWTIYPTNSGAIV